MGAMRTQAYAMCYPEEIESIITFDGVILPLEFMTKVSQNVAKRTSGVRRRIKASQ